MTIPNKAYDVPDEVCILCPQCYEGECRAFEMAHSQAERYARERRGGTMYCRRYGKMDAIINRYYSVGTARTKGTCPICRRPIEWGDTIVFIASAGSLDPIATVCGSCVRDIVANHLELSIELAPHFPNKP
jgi:hypothetical protein